MDVGQPGGLRGRLVTETVSADYIPLRAVGSDFSDTTLPCPDTQTENANNKEGNPPERKYVELQINKLDLLPATSILKVLKCREIKDREHCLNVS